MPVTKKQVLETAALCRLDLSTTGSDAQAESSDSRVERIASQLDAVVGYMDILDQADTENIEPLYSPLEHIAPPRKDRVEQRCTVNDILANAPSRQQNFFVVPPVI